MSLTPSAAGTGRHVALRTGIEASALDVTIGVQLRARSGTLTTPGQAAAQP